MSDIAPALAALESGDHERAKSMLLQAYDRAPGAAAVGLAQIAIADGDYKRAEALSRTALENFSAAGAVTLADAIGRQGRRSEAEAIALDAISSNADDGMLRAVLGEQRVRQAKWDLGTQDFVDALSLDRRDEVVTHLWRVIADLTVGHQADKVPTARALTFIDRIESAASRGDDRLANTIATARRAIQNKSVMPQTAPPVPGKSRQPPPPPAGAPASRPPIDHSAPSAPNRRAPDLISALRRDRQMNESLQDGLQKLGLPVWPSKHTNPLDSIPAMVPKNLEIDRAEFTREHLNVTTGSVASEIIIERALQALILEAAAGSATPPPFDNVGLTQLEIALWDGALDRMLPIPNVYFGDVQNVDPRALAIGAFLGACIVKPGSATWSFQNDPIASTIETTQGELEPMAYSTRWLQATDKDDVVLEEFLGEARILANLTSKFNARHDPTVGLEGQALAMKLAELWLAFRQHPLRTAQNDVTAAIRPLNIAQDIIFFALDAQFAPPVGWNQGAEGEVAMAFVRRTGEFLVLASRKHFARAVGILCKKLHQKQSALILDLFSSFYNPHAKVFHDPSRKPSLQKQGDISVLKFGAQIEGHDRNYAVVHEQGGAAPWQMLEV